jgi:nucleoside-diphosphate-sugar epimerase
MAAHRFIEALLDNHPLQLFGDGRQVRDFTYVGDVVEATVRALFADLPPAAVLDISSGRPTAVGTLIAHISSVVGRGTVPLEQLDERPGDVARTAGEIAAARQYFGRSPRTDLHTGLLRQVAWHEALRDGVANPEPALDLSDTSLLRVSGA